MKQRAEQVVVVGLGAIGAPVAEQLAAGAFPGLTLAGVLTREGAEPWRGIPRLADPEALLTLAPGVVVEAAGVEAFAALAPPCLAAGIDVVAVSAAAMADRAVEDAVLSASARGGGRLFIVSGAVGALDAISAARIGGLDSVAVIQRKPARALLDEAEAAALADPRVLSSSSAREAALRFPRNSNVAAAVALAGLGFDATRVDVVADPAERHNVVEIRAAGAFGEFTFVMRNQPSPTNPRTAMIPPMSVLAALRRRHARCVVPA